MFVTINQQQIHYTYNQTNSQKLLVFVHGAGGNVTHWPISFKENLDFSSIAIDLPGHGKSEGIALDSIEKYTDFLYQFVEQTSIKNFYLVGHSMGGAITQNFALKHSNLISGIVLLSTGPSLYVTPEILELTKTEDSKKRVAEIISLYAYHRSADESLKKIGKRMLEKTPAITLHNDFSACSKIDLSNQIENISVPTLILCGADDKMTPASYSHTLKAKIPNSILEIIPTTGHMIMLEKPEIILEFMKKFI